MLDAHPTLPDLLLAGLAAIALVSGARGEEKKAPQSQPAQGEAREHEHRHGGGHQHDTTSDDATVRHPFDDVERWVGIFDDPARDEWQKPAEVAKALGLAPGNNVADIGAGTGYFNRYFAAAIAPGGTLYAADIEPKLVEHMTGRAEKEKTPNVKPLLAAPDDPRLPAAAIDVVLVCDTYHHIDDRLDYFQRLKRSLRPGGRVAIVDFQKRDLPVGPPPEHKLAREHVVGEMEAAGYRLAREETFLPYQYFLIFEPTAKD